MSFLSVKTSPVLLVAVLSIVGSRAQNITKANNVTTPIGNITTAIATNETTTESPAEPTTASSPVTVTYTTVTSSTRTTKPEPSTAIDNRSTAVPISSPGPHVTLPPATMLTVSAITCGVIVGVFVTCYIATMMNLCFCKFLMHECPSGRFKEKGDASKKNEAPPPDSAQPPGST